MTKITLTVCMDGTNNNMNRDLPVGQETNPARIYDLLQADRAFDFSYNENDGVFEPLSFQEGTFETFRNLLSQNESLAEDTSWKVYIDGVGSQDDQSSFQARWEGATGSNRPLPMTPISI